MKHPIRLISTWSKQTNSRGENLSFKTKNSKFVSRLKCTEAQMSYQRKSRACFSSYLPSIPFIYLYIIMPFSKVREGKNKLPHPLKFIYTFHFNFIIFLFTLLLTHLLIWAMVVKYVWKLSVYQTDYEIVGNFY